MTAENGSAEIYDLEDVRVFAMAARLGNLRAAAEKLGISQSTASRRIQSFEGSLGAKVLIRSPEGVSPTDVGRRILDATTPLDSVERRITAIAGGLKRDAVVTVSCSDGIGGYWLPILMAEFADDHPEVTVKVVVRDIGRGADVTRAESDLDVSYMPPVGPDTCIVGRGTMPMRMFASPGYAMKHGLPGSLGEIVDHRVCALDAYFNPDYGDGDWRAHSDILNDHRRVTYRVNSALALGFAIRSGWGIGVQPALVEETEPGMLAMPAAVYSSTTQFWLVAHMDLKDNPAPRLLISWIRERLIKSFMGGRATFEIAA